MSIDGVRVLGPWFKLLWDWDRDRDRTLLICFLLPFLSTSSAGHLTFECRNFVRVDPRKDIVLDVSSTSSEESEEEGQQEVRKEKILGSSRSKGDKQNRTEQNIDKSSTEQSQHCLSVP